MTTFNVLALIFLSLLLIKSADIVIISLRKIAKQSHVGIVAISLIIAALGTSLPELFVGITSALEGSSNLSLGIVVGSNISNIALVGAFAALATGSVHINKDFIKHEVWIAFFAGLAPIFLIADREISRVDGMILLALYLAYTTGFFRNRFEQIGKEHESESFFYRFIREFKIIESVKIKEYGKLFTGVALLLASSDFIVKISQKLAAELKLPIFIIGLVLLALGTSLPELAFSLRSLKDHQPSMFLGNLLGSTIINSTLVLGVVTLIRPIKNVPFMDYSFAAVIFVLVFFAFWLFIRSKHRLDRWEAAVLMTLFLFFVVVEFS